MSDAGFDRLIDELLADPPPKVRPLPRTAVEALLNAETAVREDPVRIRMESAEAAYSRFWMKCARLSGGRLEICEALLREEPVPLSRLDPTWVERYGLREVREAVGGR